MAHRNYSQYANKPKITSWLEITEEISDSELSSIYDKIRLSYVIDTATTYELDILGAIVVLPRTYESLVDFDTIGFGSLNVQFGNSWQFLSGSGNISIELSDTIYRTLIKAKIAKNNSDGTVDSILDSIKFIIPDNQATIIDNNDMSFNISFQNPLSDIQKVLIDKFDIIPTPQGVEFAGYTD